MGYMEVKLIIRNVDITKATEEKEILKKFCSDHPEFQIKDLNYTERIGLQSDEQNILLLQDILKSLDKLKQAGQG